MAERLLAELREAWSSYPNLCFDLAEAEHNPLLMQVVGPSEPAVILSFQVELGGRGGLFHICLPSKPLDPILSRLTRATVQGPQLEHNTPEERDQILGRIAGSPLTLSAELASVPIALADLLALRPGDIIDTQLTRGAEVSVLLEGRPLFHGIAATHEGRRAVKITRSEECTSLAHAPPAHSPASGPESTRVPGKPD